MLWSCIVISFNLREWSSVLIVKERELRNHCSSLVPASPTQECVPCTLRQRPGGDANGFWDLPDTDDWAQKPLWGLGKWGEITFCVYERNWGVSEWNATEKQYQRVKGTNSVICRVVYTKRCIFMCDLGIFEGYFKYAWFPSVVFLNSDLFIRCNSTFPLLCASLSFLFAS